MPEREHMRRILLWGCGGILLSLAGGCALPQARLTDPTCQRVQRGQDRGALAFTVTLDTEGMVGEQLIYEVSLHDGAGRPVRSADGRYQNRSGAVAASRTVLVMESPSTFKGLPLTIPVTALPTRPSSRPVSARFGVYTVAGECLAEASCAVPPEPRRAVAARRPAPPTPPRAAAEPPRATAPLSRGQPATVPPRAGPPAAAPPAPRSTAPAERGPVARAPAPSPDEGGQPQDVAAIAAEFFWTDAGLATLQAWLAEYWMARAWLDDDTPDAAPQDNADAATSTGPRAAATDSASEMPPPADHPTDAGPAAQPSAGTDPAATATKPSSTTASARITPPLMRPYVVQRGDTLTRIAERMLGDAARWEEIYNLNRDQIHDPDTIREGMVLWILPRNSPTDD